MLEETKYFIWTPEYSVGVDLFDEQHKRFFELANAVLDVAAETDKDTLAKKIADVVRELAEYANYHLSAEEEYFEKYGYFDADIHTKAHNFYREKMKTLIAELQNGGANLKELAESIAWYAGNWLTSHIMTMDKKYERFFESRLK